MREKTRFRFVRGSCYAFVVGGMVFSLCMWWGMASGLDPDGWLQPEHLEAIHCEGPLDGVVVEGFSRPGGIFFPGEPVAVRVRLSAEVEGRVGNSPRVEVQRVSGEGHVPLGRRNRLGSAWLPSIEPLGVRGVREYPFEPGPEGEVSRVVEFADLPVGGTFGTYALMVDWGEGSLHYLGTVARVMEPVVANAWTVPIVGDGYYITGDNLDMQLMGERARALRRMGIAAVHMDMDWCEPKPALYEWGPYDRVMTSVQEADLKAIVTLGNHPEWSMPFGVPTPSVYWSNPDRTCSPRYRDAFGLFVYRFSDRYWQGGKGPLWVLENWSEPWEGMSATGWQSDLGHYLGLTEQLSLNARRVDPRIRTMGAGSIVNTELKFLTGAGAREQAEWVDVFNDRFVSPANCYGPMVAAYWGKRSMDTAAWVGGDETSLGQVMLQWLACGQGQVMPWHAGMVGYGLAGGRQRHGMPTTVVPATAAMNAFLSGRSFEGLLFKLHLPWAFQFGQGRDAVVVVTGELLPFGREGRSGLIWPQAEVEGGGEIVLENRADELMVFDACGNRLSAGENAIHLDASGKVYYLRSPSGGVDLIRRRLAAAELRGFSPVELIPRDPGYGGKPEVLHVTLHNLLNRGIRGRLSIGGVGAGQLRRAESQLSLGAGETRDVEFPSVAGALGGAGPLPLEFEFDTGQQVHRYRETLQRALVRRQRVEVDGDLGEWTRVPGVVLARGMPGYAGGFDEACAGDTNLYAAELKLAWDTGGLYVAARVQDPTTGPLHVRLGEWDQSQYFWSAEVDEVCSELETWKALIVSLPDDPAEWGGEVQRRKGWRDLSSRLTTNLLSRELVLSGAAKWYFKVKAGDPSVSFGKVSHVYRKFPGGARPYAGDTLQIGLDLIPGYEHHMMRPDTDLVPEGFHAFPDTDYEFCFYACEDGGTEAWRCSAPGVPRSPWVPRQPRARQDQGPVAGAECIVVRSGRQLVYEAFIPWGQFEGWKPGAGARLGLAVRFNDDGGDGLELGQGKAGAKLNSLTLQPHDQPGSSCVEWVLAE